MPPASHPARLKREDCPRTKHDSLFSPWKVLVGPSDWEDHSLGKEGVQRYRLHNLPETFPGLYELGVAAASIEGFRARRLDMGDVVVVYIGQADNVRARLQQYGRTGSHLDCGSSITSAGNDKASVFAAGPGLFREIFARGYSVVFRCALMSNKEEAQRTEARLLRVFDYAWNKLQNGACRREEILLKLEQEAASYRSSLLSRVRHFNHRIFSKKEGIKITRDHSVDSSSSIMENILPKVRRFVRYRPQLVNSSGNGDQEIDSFSKNPSDGNNCSNRQAHRNSDGYKVKKIDVIKRRTVPIQDCATVCGVMLEDGSSCLAPLMKGRKRCELHKGRRIQGNPKNSSCDHPSRQIEIPYAEPMPQLAANASNLDQQLQARGLMSKSLEESFKQSNSFEVKVVKAEYVTVDRAYESSLDADICGTEMSGGSACKNKDLANMGERLYDNNTSSQSYEGMIFHDGSLCEEQQPSGRMWFELLKAQKSASALSSTCARFQTRVTDDIAIICGVVTDNGHCKRIPIAGRKRCDEHKGMRVTDASFVPITASSEWPSICGAPTSDGSPCMNQPIAGRKRCALHRGQRASYVPSPNIEW